MRRSCSSSLPWKSAGRRPFVCLRLRISCSLQSGIGGAGGGGWVFYSSPGSRWLTVHDLQHRMMNGKREHISSIAQLTSWLHTDFPAEGAVEAAVGCVGVGRLRMIWYRIIPLDSYSVQELRALPAETPRRSSASRALWVQAFAAFLFVCLVFKGRKKGKSSIIKCKRPSCAFKPPGAESGNRCVPPLHTSSVP